MSSHVATIRWRQNEDDHFSLGRYTRVHEIAFDGGTTVVASASPTIVPAPYSDAAAIDPEEMFVASLSSCHMLWFLDFARRAKIEIRSYEDRAEGLMAKNAAGKLAITQVTLRPRIDSDADAAAIEDLHHKAHDACFIANSVTTEVTVEPRFPGSEENIDD